MLAEKSLGTHWTMLAGSSCLACFRNKHAPWARFWYDVLAILGFSPLSNVMCFSWAVKINDGGYYLTLLFGKKIATGALKK